MFNNKVAWVGSVMAGIFLAIASPGRANRSVFEWAQNRSVKEDLTKGRTLGKSCKGRLVDGLTSASAGLGEAA